MSSLTTSRPGLGRITRTSLAEAIRSEADLQRYLLENLSLLSEKTGVQLDNGESEFAVGSLWADLYAESDDGLTVLGELQLGRSDNRHLGQVLAYIATQRPDMFIWIAESFRAEDLTAIRLLNTLEQTRVLAVTASLLRVGSSPWALDLDVVEGHVDPVVSETREATQREELYSAFWAALSPAVMQVDGLLYSHGDSRQKLKTIVWQHGRGVEFRIVQKSGSSIVALAVVGTRTTPPEYSRAVYKALLKHKDRFATAFGAPLHWRDDARSVLTHVQGGGYRCDLSTAIPATVAAMRRFQVAATPILEQLPWDQLERLAVD